MSHDPRATWALEREIVLSRVIAAPRSRVFQAFTDPSQITRWFGPEGFTTETLEIDIREGGRWRFVYTGPDGTRYENRMVFLRVDAPRLLEIEHSSCGWSSRRQRVSCPSSRSRRWSLHPARTWS